jgi:gliding motility-associated peptidyl-prolyl isomerase
MKTSCFLILVLIFSSCSNIQPRRPINPKPSTNIYEQAIKESKRLNKLEESKIIEFIKKDTLNNYLQSANGFWYVYENKVAENVSTPKMGDEVVLAYNIKALNDSIIYSKETLGIKNYQVDKEDFISGLQKGIKLMKIGETITFVIPSYNAFGISGDGNKIGVNQTIKSTVTLITIK